MILRRAISVAAIALPIAGTPAVAQFQSPPAAQARPAPVQQPEPPCLKTFIALRNEAAKKAAAIQAASQRKQKPTARVVCTLFNGFIAAEGKLLKYAVANSTWCGIPDKIVKEIKAAHAKSSATRTKICRIAAAGPPRPSGPSLSDALGTNLPTADNIKPGHGTFDTLTGTALGNK